MENMFEAGRLLLNILMGCAAGTSKTPPYAMEKILKNHSLRYGENFENIHYTMEKIVKNIHYGQNCPKNTL